MICSRDVNTHLPRDLPSVNVRFYNVQPQLTCMYRLVRSWLDASSGAGDWNAILFLHHRTVVLLLLRVIKSWGSSVEDMRELVEYGRLHRRNGVSAYWKRHCN